MGSDRDADELTLLANLREQRASLSVLLSRQSDHWGFEDPIYRFYHQSWKVFALQSQTMAIASTLGQLMPERALNPWFLDIVSRGTGRVFSANDNHRWPEATAPVLEAFFHARYFLEMAVRYSQLDGPPTPLPSGYAALLCLYELR